ncbi:hypothetical protein [Arthrobacter oryzae]|uniref:hypothetical protein n=1 Tax=Arthrobacter oryzae TaxID=409290 RepID=UPI002857EFB6|nr:hypothetical protein [Arthrobacter oryzae]MDR6505716.1 hypothetical protein [Arthrobacter oryzae]
MSGPVVVVPEASKRVSAGVVPPGRATSGVAHPASKMPVTAKAAVAIPLRAIT